MGKKRIIAIIILLIALLGLLVYVKVAGGPAKMSDANLTKVTAPAQDEAMTNGMFTVIPYEFKKLPGNNVAINARVKANGYADVYAASQAVDGSAEGGSYWEGPSDGDSIFDLTLDNEYDINAIRIRLNPNPIWGDRTQTMKIEGSTDGKDYFEILKQTDVDFSPDRGNEATFDELKDVKAKFIRVTITHNTGAKGGQIAELEVYSGT